MVVFGCFLGYDCFDFSWFVVRLALTAISGFAWLLICSLMLVGVVDCNLLGLVWLTVLVARLGWFVSLFLGVVIICLPGNFWFGCLVNNAAGFVVISLV